MATREGGTASADTAAATGQVRDIPPPWPAQPDGLAERTSSLAFPPVGDGSYHAHTLLSVFRVRAAPASAPSSGARRPAPSMPAVRDSTGVSTGRNGPSRLLGRGSRPNGTPPEYARTVSTHAWSEHVVRVDLVSADPEVASETVRFLEGRFIDRDPEGHAEPGAVRLHTPTSTPVTAADVARALAEAGVRAHAVHDRVEWSVAECGPATMSGPAASAAGVVAR